MDTQASIFIILSPLENSGVLVVSPFICVSYVYVMISLKFQENRHLIM